MSESKLHSASFRDPAGYMFEENGRLKRLVTRHGREDYRKLISSGLYARLCQDQLLIPHAEEPRSPSWPADTEAVLLPELVPFISYPYEWSFGQLKDAALLTLRVQELAMKHGMSLKDASAFNVQFRGSRPVFIDTLSFQADPGGPWPGYSQFCRHFLGPLLMSRYLWPHAGSLFRIALDGLPLDFVSRALPWPTYLRFGCLVHIHWHARSQRQHAGPAPVVAAPARNPKAPLVSSLRAMVERLEPAAAETAGWSSYYSESHHYTPEAEAAKRAAVTDALRRIQPQLVYDLGANTGAYSRLAAERGSYCVSFDADPVCVHLNYLQARRDGSGSKLLPLVMDLSNPSPNLGFAAAERLGLDARPEADLLLALALIHHLRIAANVPLERIAEYLARLGRALLIEWVPRQDPKVNELLRSRPDTFHDYDEEAFFGAFARYFDTEQTTPLPGSGRILYLLRRKD
jgi:SAM-dependent methyltransferase